MAMLLADAELEKQLRAKRREWGADKHDEVWDGLYVMHAYPNDEHQEIVNRLCRALTDAVEDAGVGRVRPGVNVASDAANWQADYRCPDVVAFLNETQAECHGVFWTGADFVVEVASPSDELRRKFDFYAKVGGRELLSIDRDPWRIDLNGHDGAALPLVAESAVDGAEIASRLLSLNLRLVAGEARPRLLVTHRETAREWTV